MRQKLFAERLSELKRLFEIVIDLPVAEREIFVAEVCPEHLQSSLLQMLAADQCTRAPLDHPIDLMEILEAQQGALAGQQLDHYRVQDLLGQGGMGVVYRAFDTLLERTVAVKVLRPEWTDDPESRRRFVQEAKSASALNHLNIVTIHEIFTEGGVDCIAMELVNGKTLAQIIDRKPMAFADVLRYALQIAGAISCAHAAGIVHQDLKPANIMVTQGGVVKVLDFGLAKLAGPQSSVEINIQDGDSPIIGTPAYMSPEQVDGRPVDARTDIFSFGALLYEMVTGQPAFRGEDRATTLAAVRRKKPVPVRKVAPGVPREFETLVELCMCKELEHRPPDMAAVREVLASLSDPRPRPTRLRRLRTLAVMAVTISGLMASAWWFYFVGYRPGLSIVVLPFENSGKEGDAGLFVDSLSGQLAYRLVMEPGFIVKNRPADAQPGRSPRNVKALARQLNVAVALSGSVQTVGRAVRITAQLISSRTGYDLWSGTYELDRDHLLDLEDLLATAIVRTLQNRFGGLTGTELLAPPTHKSAALKWYLKARDGWQTQRRTGLLGSLEFYQKAISEDPEYAEAYAGLAASELFLASIEGGSKSRVAEAKAHAERAVALNDRLAEAHAILANIYLDHEWNIAAAENELKRSLALQPGTSAYEYWYAQAAVLHRHFDDALAELDIGRMVNPKSDTLHMATGLVYLAMGRLESAQAYALKALALNPHDLFNRRLLGLALEQRGEYAAAAAELRVCADHPRDPVKCLPALGHALALSGNRAAAREILRKLEPNGDGVSRALLWIGLHDHKRALQALHDAYEQHEPKLPWVAADARFLPLVNEPEFHDLIARIGIP